MTRLSRRYEKKRRSKVKEKRKRIYKKIVEYRERVREAKRIAKKKRKPKQKKLPTDYEILQSRLARLERSLIIMEKQLKKLKKGTREYTILKRRYDRELRKYNEAKIEFGKYNHYTCKTWAYTFDYDKRDKIPRFQQIFVTLDMPSKMMSRKLFIEVIDEIRRYTPLSVPERKKWERYHEEGARYCISTHYTYYKKDIEIYYEFRYMDKDMSGNDRLGQGTVKTTIDLKNRARHFME